MVATYSSVQMALNIFVGRGGNAWLSPDGCAMFSLHVRVSVASALGEKVSNLQHIASLAVVLAVRGKPGYEVCPLLWVLNQGTR